MNLLALEFVGNLAQMQRRAGQPVQARHHERIVLPDLLQAGLEPLSPAGSTAFLLLKDLIAAGELVELDVETLPDTADPRLADARHGDVVDILPPLK